MSDIDTNLLKLDMQITAKRLKLRDKATNILQTESYLKNTFTKTKSVKNDALNIPSRKKTSKENKNSVKATTGYHRKRRIQRPVDYTWNRGGRLKEIRIRTQARKFLFLWVKKTFGKVTYSQAQSYYLTRIKSKCFKTWKDFWWEQCGEMKMLVRAECFSKYQIYIKVWMVWKQYVTARRTKKELTLAADMHYSTVSNKKIINLWKIYVQLRKTKKAFYNRAYNIADNTLTKRCWTLWYQNLKKKLDAKANYQLAATRWEDLTLKKAWTFWCNRYNDVLQMKYWNQKAVEKLRDSLTKRHFFYWRNYVNYRRRKYALYNKARNLYNLSLKHKTICLWWTRYESLLEYREKMYACHVLCLKSTKRRYFSAWIHFVDAQNQKRRQQAVAHIHYRRCLKQRSFECLKMSVLLKQKKIGMLYTALKFYASTKLRHSWMRWQQRIEQIEEVELVELSAVAKEHYRSKLIRRTFTSVVRYKQQRKTRKRKIMKAETHFVVKALPRCFNQWRKFVDVVKDVNQMKKDADNFHREVLSTKYFYAWYSTFEKSQEERTRERMAVMLYSENALRHHFQLWLHKTRIILSNNHNDAVARVYYRRSLLHIAITSWTRYAKDSMQRKRKLDFADSYHRDSVRAGAWLAWKNYVAKSRLKNSKHDRADSHNHKQLLLKAFKSWQTYWQKGKDCELQAQQRFDVKCQELEKEIFAEWRKNSAARVGMREAERRADSHRQNRLQSIVFSQWKQWNAVRRFKSEQTKQSLDRAVSSLNKFKLQRWFHKWKESKDAKKLENFNLAASSRHYYNRICKLVFQAWQLHKYILLKKKLMQRQAAVFRRSLLLRKCTEAWKTALHWKYDETTKSCDALWHWAVSLQGRCFDNWRNYIIERKCKKQRYNQAMDARRSHVMKEGCVKMLEFHAKSLARRTQLEACQQAKARYTGYHIAWKYGKRWIDKVRLKLEEKKQAAFSTGVKSFSFATFPPAKVSTSNFQPWIPRPLPIVKERLPVVNYASEAPLSRCVSEKQRPAPRLPDFLDDSLRREGIFDDYLSLSEQRQTQRHSVDSNFSQMSRPCSSTAVLTQSATLSSNQLYSKVPVEKFSTSDEHRNLNKRQSALHSPPAPSNANPRGVVLMPPSAFCVLPQHSAPSHRSSEDEKSLNSPFDSESSNSTCTDDRKETFKTFVASPSSTREELKLIYKKLQEFQKLRDQLKVLKQQKEVLKSCIEDNLATMSTSKSLDMASVQEEIKEIDNECSRISQKLLVKRPEVENLAVRVRVLSAKPT